MTVLIPSHSDPATRYTVNLLTNECGCPDFTHRRAPGCGHAQAGTDCKHLVQARKDRRQHLSEIAGTLETEELLRLLAKYRTVEGKGEVVGALLFELADREALASLPVPVPEVAPEAAPEVPPVPANLGRPTCTCAEFTKPKIGQFWQCCQHTRTAAPAPRFEAALDNARARKFAELSETEQKAIWA